MALMVTLLPKETGLGIAWMVTFTAAAVWPCASVGRNAAILPQSLPPKPGIKPAQTTER